MKIGILSGSFDPIHYGHLILAEQVINEAKLDLVVFLPEASGKIKKASFVDRYNLIQLAIQDNKKFLVSNLEATYEEPSLYEDMNKFKALYPEDDLYVVMGQDAFMAIESLPKGNDLLKENSFLIGQRPGETTRELFGFFKELFMRYGKLSMEFFEFPELEMTTTTLQNKIKVGKSVKYWTPDKVMEYIDQHNLYDCLLPKLKAFVKSNVKESRYKHTEGVVETARKLAVRYDVDPKKAEIAAWFHDAYRSAGNLEHGPVAAEKIKTDFNVNDEDIIQAICNHTTGRPGMSKLDKVIYVADSLEPNRDYPGVEELRKIMYVDLDEVLYKLMVNTRNYVMSIGGTFDPLSNEAIADLEEKLKKNG